MNAQLEAKLKELPSSPGIYIYKDAKGEIIYIGKAAILKNRVRQYFQKSRFRDPKTDALVAEIASVDWTVVDSEIDALFLEAEMVRRYLPRYNILLRDDKSSAYVRISYSSAHPTVTVSRRPLDDGARYFGPYFNANAVRRALKYLRRAFPYSTHIGTVPNRACLLYHLGLCPGLEGNKTSLTAYRANLRKLMEYLRGERVKLIRELEGDMKKLSNSSHFEEAALRRNQLFALKGLGKQIIFSDKEFLDISKDQGLAELGTLLGFYSKLTQLRRIEGYDISHMSGTDTVASMVVFTNGIPDKTHYRKFKMRIPGNDDFAHMHEALSRRLAEKHRGDWQLPNLILIDGGKGQLGAALKARSEQGLNIPMIGLAKREEEIIVKVSEIGEDLSKLEKQVRRLGGFMKSSSDFVTVTLPPNSPTVKLLQRIRDESHRFAVSYHSVLKTKRQTSSLLDDIPSIGPATHKKLLRTFGSFKGIQEADYAALATSIGPSKAAVLRKYLAAESSGSEVTTTGDSS